MRKTALNIGITKWFRHFGRTAALLAVVALCLTGASKKLYSPRDKAFYADAALVGFVNPGLTITINSAQIAQDGTITTVYTLTDPNGVPLDAAGVTTPGAISLGYIAAVLPNDQEEYTAYTTRANSGPAVSSTNQPGPDSGGVTTNIGPGQYQYVFNTKAPSGFDATATHTIGIYASRVLTNYNLGTNYASAEFNFVPNGAQVTKVHDIIKTASCNSCHDQLAWHGGRRRGIEMCVLCHTQQNVDTTTGGSLDLKVMIHEMHMGAQLPSVVAGQPLIVNGKDFSKIVDPADPRRCEVCHSQTTGAVQATAFLGEPSRAACGACHNDVNFATGVNHPGGPQPDDNQCHNCHIPQGELPFDASIMGAHIVPTDTAKTYPQNPDTLLPGINLAISSVTNTLAGQTPIVNFTLQDDKGNNIPVSSTTTLSFTMAGPTSDFGYTNFGSGTASTPGYVTESVKAPNCNPSGACSYTFTHAIPTGATGTYTIGGESRTSVTVLGGTTESQTVQIGAFNPVVNFSVDGSPVTPRRNVVALSNCNNCHVSLSLHGGLRNNTEYCVLCHNPSNTDASTRSTATVASYQNQPPQGINFNLLVHRIHNGVNAAADNPKNPYVVIGHGGSVNDFSGVLFPAMSPAGSAPYLQNCSMCHVNGSEQNDLTLSNLNQVTDPQGWINPTGAFSSACSGCHVSQNEASHFEANSNSLGESCSVCHATGAQFAVDAVHAQ